MSTRLLIISFAIFSLVALMVACEKIIPVATPEDQILDGPVAELSYAENQRFLLGDLAFNDEIFTKETGLGPVFVATSCGSCHAGDGKGHPFSTLIRFGQTDETGNKFLNHGGPQLQNRAIPGYAPETIPVGATFSKFTPPANTGLGFLELVSDSDILAMADPNDEVQDGISGIPNYAELPEYVTPFKNSLPKSGKYIHRFGKKASTYNLLHQTVSAYNQDIGIASSFDPVDVYTRLVIDPEISNQTINNVVFYLQTLKAPIQRDQDNAEVKNGSLIFNRINCSGCHKPTLKTGASTIKALSSTTFHPYTDLLLHDMGNSLDDGYTEGSAKTFEWRTPALWGLGLSANSQGGQYHLLHDGRAKSIEEAITLHGGEAIKARNLFVQLSTAEKENLLKFLKSL
jgi:CxxC motif-containing protein (DUF1111 family)